MSALLASACIDLNSTDSSTVVSALQLIMECSTRMFDLEDHREYEGSLQRTRRKSKQFPEGVLDRIVELLQCDQLSVRVQASHAVFNMSASREVRNHMTKVGVLPHLVSCLMPHIALFGQTESPAYNGTNATSLNTPSSTTSFSTETTLSNHEQQELLSKNALGALANFAVNSVNKNLIVDHGALAPIVDTLERTQKDNARQHACRCLFALASDNENKHAIRAAIVAAGALRPLIQCLRHDSSHVQWHAAGALANLSLDASSKSKIVAHGGLEAMVELAVSSDSDKVQRQVARGIFALTCKAEIRERVVACGGLAPIVNLLSSRQKDLRRDAAGALGNVAMSPPLIAKVVEAGALSPLVELAKSSVDEEVQKEVIRTLYILSYDEGTRRLIVQCGGLEPLVRLASDGADVPKGVQEKAAGCLANIACGKGNKHYVVRAGGLNPMLGLLRHSSTTTDIKCTGCEGNGQCLSTKGLVKCTVCQGKGSVTVAASKEEAQGRKNTSRQRSGSRGSGGSSSNSSSNDSYSAQRQAARALFALSGLPENQKCIVKDGDGLQCLVNALESEDKDVSQYAAGAIANIALGIHCGDVVKEGSVSKLLKLAKSSVLGVQIQAIRGLTNIFKCPTSGEKESVSGGGKEEDDADVSMGDGTSSGNNHMVVPGPDPLSNEQQRMVVDMTNAFDGIGNVDDVHDLVLQVVHQDGIGGGNNNGNSYESKGNDNHHNNNPIGATVACHWAIMASSSNYFANLTTIAATDATGERPRTLSVQSGSSQHGKECWEIIVEFCYVGQVRSPCEEILNYCNDRRLRRKTTSQDKKKLYQKCKFYHAKLHAALLELIQQFHINGMKTYIMQFHKACMKLLKIAPSSAATPTTTATTVKTCGNAILPESEQRFDQLLRCRWGLHDVVFRTGDGTLIGAHRVIICARSTYFRAMLAPNSQFSEASMDQIPVQVEEGAVFSILIRYMYTGSVENEIEPGNCFDILNASHLYGLVGLQTEAEDYIAKECMNLENVVDIINATLGILVPRLRMAAIAFVVVHIDEMNKEIEDVEINDDWWKEYIVDRYYHWNQGNLLWGSIDELKRIKQMIKVGERIEDKIEHHKEQHQRMKMYGEGKGGEEEEEVGRKEEVHCSGESKGRK